VDVRHAVKKRDAAPLRLLRLFLLLAFLPSPVVHAQRSYDLVLKGGHVIDPKNGIDAVRDVAIKDHKIAEVAAHIQRGPGVTMSPLGWWTSMYMRMRGRAKDMHTPGTTACIRMALPCVVE
jgi:hypothetical protein